MLTRWNESSVTGRHKGVCLSGGSGHDPRPGVQRPPTGRPGRAGAGGDRPQRRPPPGGAEGACRVRGRPRRGVAARHHRRPAHRGHGVDAHPHGARRATGRPRARRDRSGARRVHVLGARHRPAAGPRRRGARRLHQPLRVLPRRVAHELHRRAHLPRRPRPGRRRRTGRRSPVGGQRAAAPGPGAPRAHVGRDRRARGEPRRHRGPGRGDGRPDPRPGRLRGRAPGAGGPGGDAARAGGRPRPGPPGRSRPHAGAHRGGAPRLAPHALQRVGRPGGDPRRVDPARAAGTRAPGADVPAARRHDLRGRAPVGLRRRRPLRPAVPQRLRLTPSEWVRRSRPATAGA